MNSMCQLVGSSFSNSIGVGALALLMFNCLSSWPSRLHSFSSSASISTGSFDFSFFSSVSILTFFGMKGFLLALEAILATVSLSFSRGMFNMVAKMLAPDWTSSRCKGSSTENSRI